MGNRTLLELAAKAAGIEHGADRLDCGVSLTAPDSRYRYLPRWNPLKDDGDALRLAARLRMCIDIRSEHTEVTPPGDFCPESEEHENDPCAATRLAIVRAAAEIGRTME